VIARQALKRQELDSTATPWRNATGPKGGWNGSHLMASSHLKTSAAKLIRNRLHKRGLDVCLTQITSVAPLIP